MILDAVDLRAGGGRRPDPARRRRARPAGLAEDGALRLGLRDEHERLHDGCGDRRGAAGAPASRGGRGAGRGAGDRRRRDPSVCAARGAADRQGGALRDVRRLRRHLRAPPGRAGAARARRHAVGGRVLALPGRDPPVAAGRARHVGELTLVRRRAERDGVQPRPDPRRAAARRSAARVRVVRASGSRGSSGSPRSASRRTTRASGGTSARTRSSARSRCACPTSRPTCISPLRSRRSCRRSARRRSKATCRATACCSPTAAGPTTSRTGGRPRGSGPRAKLVHPDGSSYVPVDELGSELLELVRPAARALGGADVLGRLDPATCEADLQLEQGSPEEAAADLVVRSLG